MTDIISIVVPVYNVEAYLEDCVNSILAQSYKNLQIILVDDGSTDSSGHMCDSFAKADDRITVVHQANGGLACARNVGIAAATGQWLLFVDSDDYIAPELCQSSLCTAKEKNADIVVFNVTCVSQSKKPLFDTERLTEGALSAKDALSHLLKGDIHDYAVNKLFKKELFDDIAFPLGRAYEDLGTMYKVFDNAKNVYCLEKSFYFYRRRSDSVVGQMTDKTLCDLYAMRKTRLDYMYSKHPDIAPLGIKMTAFSALSLYDRSLWSQVEEGTLADALKFLQQNKAEALKTGDGWMKLYLRSPALYRILRRLKHGVGTLVKKCRK